MVTFNRRKTISATVGNVNIGSDYPIRIQSMTNTHTTDIKESVDQTIKLFNNGCEIIRFATQGSKEVDSLKEMKTQLIKKKYNIPLIADVHFNANVANIAAEVVDKVRVNPGNYSKKEAMEEKFTHLIKLCKKHNTAIRVGVNHGSLSVRILQKYGNTPEGMVVSCMEFLRICKQEDFNNVVVSLKASNTAMMIKSNRLLVEKMQKENMAFPLHLGVTEAGDGESGRIKSAVGIGTLLNEGIGDTIRVSLTETPLNEPIFAKKLTQYISQFPSSNQICNKSVEFPFKFTSFYKRPTCNTKYIGNEKTPVVIVKANQYNQNLLENREEKIDFILMDELSQNSKLFFIESKLKDITSNFIKKVNLHENVVLIAKSKFENSYALFLQYFHYLYRYGCKAPVIIHGDFFADTLEDFQLKTAVSMGGLFVDGLANGIFLESESNKLTQEEIINTSFEILQATGVRMSKAEFISCPGCGRTFFELEEVNKKVKNAFHHLKHLKIAVMGCIVNGIGEMGDADYGYVGSSAEKINLYKGKKLIARNIPDNQAIEELKKIIIKHNDWKEK